MTFQKLGLRPEILRALAELHYETPSPIQAQAIPPALAGRDVLGCARTGTGKTCAFAAPILQRLARKNAFRQRRIGALVLTPTRELALQIQESFTLYGKYLPLRSAVIFGGVGQQPQVDQLKAGIDILVATPGRLLDLYHQGFIHVEKLEILVLDEADRMLDMGFIHDVQKILSWLPQKKQTLFFSATMPPEVQGLVDSLLHDPARVEVDPVSSPVDSIRQQLYYVDRSNKSKLLAQLLRAPEVKNALVFTRTKHGANKVAGDLLKAGIPAAAIHGNKSQTARQQALSDFKKGRVRVLVATDIAARGIDIEELSHVFNYNLPDVPETYVHRIGRTGRAGRGGIAISFCEFGEKDLLAPIERLLKKRIPVVEKHDFPMVNLEPPKRDRSGKVVNADDAEARQAARTRKKARMSEPTAEGPARRKPSAAKNAATQAAPILPPTAIPLPGEPFGKRFLADTEKPVHPLATPAAKRLSAGYKPSKTLEEALHAMEPKWTEEEKKRMATVEPYRDPLAGEAVMDATARLLSSRKRIDGPSKRKDPPNRDGRRKKNQKSVRAETVTPSASRARSGAKPSAKTGFSAHWRGSNIPRERERSHSGRRPPTLHFGNQKDSTQQRGSLMKPYYFNPNEDA